MSTSTCTYLWISPKDYAKKKVRAILDDKFNFEYEDEDDKPDDEGLLRLSAFESYSYDEMTALRDLGVGFFAREDSRCESEGNECVFVAWRKKYVYMQEDGAGRPVIRVHMDGKVDKNDLKEARSYWKLHAKVIAAAMASIPHSVTV